ncbi:MAG: hypothetical protein AAFX94_13665, partial [Myxococcota bacterium]
FRAHPKPDPNHGGEHVQRASITGIGRWKNQVLSGPPITFLEHSALQFLLRRQLIPESEARPKLEESWERMTGHVPRDLTRRLPSRVLSQQHTLAVRVHQAAIETPANPSTVWDHLSIVKEALADMQLVTPRNMVLVGGAIALGVKVPLLGAAMLGAAHGLSGVSIFERVFHHVFGHEDHGTVGKLRDASPAIGEGIERMNTTHDAHHFRNFRTSYHRQFDTPEQVEELKAFLAQKHGEDFVERRFAADGDGIGQGLSRSEAIAFGALTAVCLAGSTGAILAGAAVAGVSYTFAQAIAFAVGSLAPTPLMPWASGDYHPRVHQPLKQLDTVRDRFMNLWNSSQIGRYTALLHDEHHRRCWPTEDGRDSDVNLNLNTAGLGDLLAGKFRRPSLATVLAVNVDGGLH